MTLNEVPMSFGMTGGRDGPSILDGPGRDLGPLDKLPLDRSGLHILGRAECLAALGPSGVGAITVTRGALPIALPIGYAVHNGSLVVRVSPRSILAHTSEEVVAFCAYAADMLGRRGWSVSATGMARRVIDPDHLRMLADGVGWPWSPGGLHDVFLAMAPTHLSGRLLTPG